MNTSPAVRADRALPLDLASVVVALVGALLAIPNFWIGGAISALVAVAAASRLRKRRTVWIKAALAIGCGGVVVALVVGVSLTRATTVYG